MNEVYSGIYLCLTNTVISHESNAFSCLRPLCSPDCASVDSSIHRYGSDASVAFR